MVVNLMVSLMLIVGVDVWREEGLRWGDFRGPRWEPR